MEPVKADGSEGPYTRAVMVSSIQRTGNLILPHPLICSWAQDIVDSFASFPNAKHDDDVASICQAVRMMKAAKPVLPGFSPKLQSYKIPWKELGKEYQFYISQYVDGNLQTSIIMALWSTKTGRLVVFDEFTVNTTLPEYIRPMLEMKITRVSGGIITKLDRFAWYGNAFMFARSARGLSRSSIQVDGIAESYIRSGIPIQDNILYEEAGSIHLMLRMNAAGAILFDQRAAETIRQGSAWQYEGDTPAGCNGCIRAVCNIASVLYEAGRNQRQPKEIKAYSETRQKIYAELKRRSSEDGIDDWIRSVTSGSSYSNKEKSGVRPEERWMV
jgi:hypothetical protein